MYLDADTEVKHFYLDVDTTEVQHLYMDYTGGNRVTWLHIFCPEMFILREHHKVLSKEIQEHTNMLRGYMSPAN